MSRRGKIVGFDRKLELAWLDATAGQVARGATPNEVRSYLWKMLEGSVSAGSSGFNSDRGKTITVLVHVWSQVPEPARGLRDRSVALLGNLDPRERMVLHWAQCLATYPFFHDVALTVGQSLVLQDRAVLSDVRRRLAEKWGDRDIVARASQRILRTLVAWDLLADAGPRGSYVATPSRLPVGSPVAELLVEAVLLNSGGRSMRIGDVMESPALFPFELVLSVGFLRSLDFLTVSREGVGGDLVALRERPRAAAIDTGARDIGAPHTGGGQSATAATHKSSEMA